MTILDNLQDVTDSIWVDGSTEEVIQDKTSTLDQAFMRRTSLPLPRRGNSPTRCIDDQPT